MFNHPIHITVVVAVFLIKNTASIRFAFFHFKKSVSEVSLGKLISHHQALHFLNIFSKVLLAESTAPSI